LQHGGFGSIADVCASFNPYRVFKFVATPHPGEHFQAVCVGFNPYRVFKFVATYQGVLTTPYPEQKFQSLSGFQVRCNTKL